MRFVPGWWQSIALTLTGLNLAGAGFAAAIAEPFHAGAHVVVGLACGYWARWLGTRGRGPGDRDRIEMLEAELDRQRLELAEAQERLDFAERLLSQAAEKQRELG